MHWAGICWLSLCHLGIFYGGLSWLSIFQTVQGEKLSIKKINKVDDIVQRICPRALLVTRNQTIPEHKKKYPIVYSLGMKKSHLKSLNIWFYSISMEVMCKNQVFGKKVFFFINNHYALDKLTHFVLFIKRHLVFCLKKIPGKGLIKVSS